MIVGSLASNFHDVLGRVAFVASAEDMIVTNGRWAQEAHRAKDREDIHVWFINGTLWYRRSTRYETVIGAHMCRDGGGSSASSRAGDRANRITSGRRLDAQPFAERVPA